MNYLNQYDAHNGFLVSGEAKMQEALVGLCGDCSAADFGKWRIWCWLGGYGVDGGRVLDAEGRG
jgi:hypothetical protein